MKLKIIKTGFSVCKVEDCSLMNLAEPFVFTGNTDEEKSLVCPTAIVPKNTIERDDGWRAFRIEGVLDFALIGILAKIATILAEVKVGVFAVSTFNTDYILTKSKNFDNAIEALVAAGYEIDK